MVLARLPYVSCGPHLITPARSRSAAVTVAAIDGEICVPICATRVFKVGWMDWFFSIVLYYYTWRIRPKKKILAASLPATSVIASSREGYLLRDKLAHYISTINNAGPLIRSIGRMERKKRLPKGKNIPRITAPKKVRRTEIRWSSPLQKHKIK